MATKGTLAGTRETKRTVEAPVLGSSRLAPPARDVLVHPDPAPLHAVPLDTGAEATLARVEELLGKGHFGTALREAGALKIGDGALAGRYEFIRQEKVSRAQIG